MGIYEDQGKSWAERMRASRQAPYCCVTGHPKAKLRPYLHELKRRSNLLHKSCLDTTIAML
jgi:hypothetical protein